MTPKRCESVGCKYAANFGDTTQRTRRFCARHKLGGMLSYRELVGEWGLRGRYCCINNILLSVNRTLVENITGGVAVVVGPTS